MPIPRLSSTRLAAVCALATTLLLVVVAGATAKTVGVDVRVVNTDGAVLAEQRQYTDTVRIKTDPQADCFGSGTGGSGKTVTVEGPTALGLVRDASESDRDLLPLSVTDAFDFGLGVCGIGGFEAQGSGFWYLKADHEGAQVGGDTLRVSRGQDILWYLTPTFPPPDELELRAPARAQRGKPFEVRVFRWSDGGVRTPAAGVSVTGAELPTGADGTTEVTLEGSRALRARLSGAIPSNAAAVCVAAQLTGCPVGPALAIFGSSGVDRIVGTGGPNRISARGGRDRVNVRGGGPDRVNCGRGRDTVLLNGADEARGCERRIRPA